MTVAVLLLVSFWLYAIAVFEAKRHLLPNSASARPLPPLPKRAIHRCLILVSPDYWWAERMKERVPRGALRGAYVWANNRMNVLFSLNLASACLVSKELAPRSLLFCLLGTIAVIRLFSRSYEIAYAFGKDVLQRGRSSTGLRKDDRIRLALLTYLEIYLYSMAAYTVLPPVLSAREALTLALNVGTLTNVGYAYPNKETPLWFLVVFIQVFTTLSLVVLSLAAYLSRKR